MTQSSPASVLLSASNLSIGYDQKVIADRLNLRIRSGELICLLGPNGAGKSTLLKTLSGILSPKQGTISIGPH
ncbi:MAG: ATP-binding cassette domain-containing protein, partial [Bacteroidota bacterium]